LAELERELAQEFYATLEGQKLEVLIEQPSETEPGRMRGTDRRYVPVELPGTTSDLGQFVPAIGEAAGFNGLSARRLDGKVRIEV
jgi:threonylcarbamoyladenosine tRNA methylthiotransferase MtaB